ncbi:cell wall biosynthesis protein [Methanobrevibacter filiformis]|uniref:Cell wall biosynthesis protein n=1 Tax=Methanobrevibacter filiformis TaxID=55758 RepID=A0A166F053_9EURY|nr:cell wall biosynthesis protein [Methanobrevibacter filiformis]KZX17188.1 hypothetical protein MBFIL_03120 [Methanobrevibacter filiformis]
MTSVLLNTSISLIIWAFILAFVSTMALNIIFRKLAKLGVLGNLYSSSVRGGTPRGIGVVPFILLSVLLPPRFNELVLLMGIFAFLDDILGRRKIGKSSIEWGQLFRGIGILSVICLGYPLMGPSIILVALLVQPLNISDMQPGITCSVVILMSVFTVLSMFIIGIPVLSESLVFFSPIIIAVICLGYAPLDYKGLIMMGEVGNHAFAIALGIIFYLLGGFIATFLLFIATTALIAFMRRKYLKQFLTRNLGIKNPCFGDYFMDILTGGGLGDLVRRILLGKKQIKVTIPILIIFGFRRLLYNPYAPYRYNR